MIFSTSLALLSLSLPEKERGGAIGINISFNLTSFALGFLAGGYLTYYISWRSIFFATLPIDAMVLALIFLKLPGECALSECKRLDLRGSALCAITLFLIIVGFSKLPEMEGIIILIIGFAALVGFVLLELRSNCPVIDVKLFATNRSFSLSNLAALIYFTSSFAAIFIFSLYMQYIRGFGERSVGILLLVFTLIMVGFVSYSGRLSDRVRPHRIASLGVVITALGLLLLRIFIDDATTPVELVMSGLVLTLIGSAFFQPPVVKCVLSSISRDMYGVGSGTVEMMRLTGQTVSMAVVILIFTLYLGGTEIVPESYPAFLDSLKVIFSVLFVLALASLVLMVMVGRSEKVCV